jgi:hypothetical protein
VPKTVSEKCRLRAKLSATETIAKHDPTGTGRWEGDKCHKRRTYYRNRERHNIAQRIQYRGVKVAGVNNAGQTAVLVVAPPTVPAHPKDTVTGLIAQVTLGYSRDEDIPLTIGGNTIRGVIT